MASSAANMAFSLSASQQAQAESEIDNTGRISLYQFKVALGVLLGIALLCFFGRLSIRLCTRRRLYVDDGFLALAFLCLCGGTFILYERIQMVYLEFAVLQKVAVAYPIAMEQMNDLYNQSRWQLAYLVLLWTAVFAVKWCYFAFFHPLIRAMPWGFVYYYWFSIAFSVVSWLFIVVGEQLITCPYVGKASAKCFPNLPASHAALLATFWVSPCLDALTDLMVISFPVIILRKAKLRTLTKIGLGSFLCLSTFMFSCSIIRAAGTYYQGTLDFPWQVFWLHSEGCIGVIMASITVYRSTLIGSGEVSNSLKVYFAKISIPGWKRRRTTEGGIVMPEQEKESQKQTTRWFKLVHIPSARLSGLYTLFGSITRTRPTAIHTGDSEVDLTEVDPDYHAYLKPSHIAPKTAAEATAISLITQERVEYAGSSMGFLMAMSGYQVILQHRTIGSGSIDEKE